MGLKSMRQVKFAAITIGVAAIFALGGLAFTKLQPESSTKPSQQKSSANLPEKIDLPQTDLPTRSYPKLSELKAPLSKLTYKYINYPNFQHSQELQSIVDEVVSLAQSKKLPTKDLSVSLIDVHSRKFAEYQQDKLRYPASVVKLFWMVALYGQFEAGLWPNPKIFTDDLYKMIGNSDNEASSRILDAITDTTSGQKLSKKEYQTWLDKRYSVNLYFQQAGYQEIDISQKTFPIPYLGYSRPQGRELQMRKDPKNPIRNKISTQQAARLMYELVTGRSIAPKYSENMVNYFLLRDLTPEAWKNIDSNFAFNPIRAFFGESLPTDVYFASKAGWTSQTRQEVAFISNSDGKVAYILAVFAEDSAYARDQKIFPEISRLVYQRQIDRDRLD